MAAMRKRVAAALVRTLSPASPPRPVTVRPRAAFSGTYLPFTHDMTLRSWLFALLRAVVVERGDTALRVRPLLPTGATTALIPMTARFHRTPLSPVATHLFTGGRGPHGPVRGVSGHLPPTRPRGSLRAARRLGGRGLCRRPERAGRTRHRRRTAVRPSLGETGGPAVLLRRRGYHAVRAALWVLRAGRYGPARPSPPARPSRPHALVLLLGSLLWPSFAVLGSFHLARGWRVCPRYVRVGGLLTAAVYLLIAGVLAWLGWLRLLTWRA